MISGLVRKYRKGLRLIISLAKADPLSRSSQVWLTLPDSAL
jgi:hypothetical protein